MPSTFFGLEIASSGLRASNAALNTTANNISNVNTEGYSRQAVKTEAMNPLRVLHMAVQARASIHWRLKEYVTSSMTISSATMRRSWVSSIRKHITAR